MGHLLLSGFFLGLLLGLAVGWYWWSRRGQRHGGRALVEDALKHLHDYEYRDQPASVESLAGVLAISVDRATQLVEDLESMGLVGSPHGSPQLTSEGRQYALRMIRIHRLWEQYLAERTGISEREWHGVADYHEHRITTDEANALSASMGHPRFDPHGDPIPTADGEVPPVRGQPLSTLSGGDLGLIVHVEDEPAAVYEQLLAQGLSRGMRLLVTEKTARRICVEVDGHEHVLAPVVAANLTIERLPKAAVSDSASRRLSDLVLGEEATVLGILPACRGPQRRRLLDLGLIPGTPVAAELSSPGGEPTAYRIRGALIALRKEQTALIRVRTHEPAGASR
ncbi:MAG: iron dependent repressor, metal binding and dimerization domain protein [Pirellulaceae bacterium]